MKQVLILFATALFSLSVFAQSKAPIILTPGVGIGKLKLGMSEEQARDLLGGEPTERNYTEEMESFKSSTNFHIDSIPQFVIGFDKCLAYMGNLPEDMPVFNMYFKNDKLVYITVTTYGVDKALAKRVLMKGKIRFFDPMKLTIARMGGKYIPISYGDYSGDHVHYLDGVELTYDEKILTTIAIFKPIKNYFKMIADNSERIRREWEELGGTYEE